jgi:hypothetical protein
LKTLRLPQDRETLRNSLLWVDAIQLDMASYWIGKVKKELPKLFKAIDKWEHNSVLRLTKGKRTLSEHISRHRAEQR